jgi:hypothetical protein
MKSEPKENGDTGRFEGENEWKGRHERRKRNWSEQDRRLRKERRHPEQSELDEALELLTSSGFLS